MGGGKITVGQSVIYNNNFFAAGVWDGVCDDGDLLNAQFPCCTGAEFYNNRIVFVTPIHLQEAIYSIKTDDTLFISNSVPFVLEASHSDLDVNYYDYEHDFCSVLFGYDGYVRETPLANGRILNIYRCQHVTIDDNLHVSVERKWSHLHFDSYSDYVSKVKSILTKIYENSVSPMRSVKYGSVSSISRGYDAPASSVLAMSLHCNETIGFNAPAKYLADLGTEIAHKIGYDKVYEVDALEYMSNTDCLEALAFCSGDASMLFGSYKEIIGNKLLVVGTRGDSVWSKDNPIVNNDFIFTRHNGLSQASICFNEYGLHCNCVQIAPPLIGADSWTEISKITSSVEMDMYSLHNNYDRPIPRRLVEEAGVNRNEFGQGKKGGGLTYHYDTINSMKRKMSSHSHSCLVAYKRKLKRNPMKKLAHYWKYIKAEYPMYFNYISSRLHLHKYIPYKESYISSPLSSILILWGIDTTRKHYKI